MEPDSTFTRRVCAVLLADVTGFSTLMGEDDERTARAVHHLQAIAQGIVSDANGRAEPVAGDALFATFDSVVAAVQAAVAIQRRIAGEPFEGQALQIRIGVHLGDVLLRDGRAFGDAINIAARLEALARPGTICISDTVCRQVRNKFDEQFVDLGRQKLKNISDPVHAYLIVPNGTARGEALRPTLRWAFAAAALAVLGAATVLSVRHWAATTPQSPSSPAVESPLAHVEDRKSVAVLPFVNMSTEADEYLSDGMSEEIITALSKVSGLRVAARTSSFFFKGKNEDIKVIGEQLRVGSVLEGSVRKAGPKLRVTAQLINISDGYHVWSETYDEDMADVLAIEGDVARRVAAALQVTLLAREQERLQEKPTENPEAHHLYLKGRYYASRWTEEGASKGLTYLQQAIDLDPRYARAYQGLAYYYWTFSDWGLAPKDAMPKARAAAEKALQIEPGLADAHAILGKVHIDYDWDFPAAEDEYKRALALDDNCILAHEYYGYSLGAVGRAAEGVAEARRAVEIDPLSSEANAFLGAGLYFARRYDEAIGVLRETAELDPSYWFTHEWLGQSYVRKGDVERGSAAIRRARDIDPHNSEVLGTLGHAYTVAGERDAARQIIEELRQQAQQRFVSGYNFAVIYAGLGDADQAFGWLQKAYDDRSFYLVWLKGDPRLDPLRSDPRFTALLKKVGLEP